MPQHRLIILICVGLLLQLASMGVVQAHPGSGIAVDKDGIVYFTDTAKGVWKLAVDGKLELISPVAWHFMGLDASGVFSESRKEFGNWFARATPEGSRPTIIECSDFPMAIGKDGNLYYANTMRRPAKIVKRTPEGKETTIAEIADEQAEGKAAGKESYVTGMTVAPDGTIYLIEAAAQREHVVIRKIGRDGVLSEVARSFVPADLKFEPVPAIAASALPPGARVPMIARNYCRGLAVAGDGTIYVAANACRAVLAIDGEKKVRVVLQAEAPWGATDVAIRNGEVYVLEYDHTGDDRQFWMPRVRKVNRDGKIETLVTVARN